MLTLVVVPKKKKIFLSVSNDLNSDQRLHKVCNSLMRSNYEVILLGRYLPGRSLPIQRDYLCKRFKLWFTKGPLFYLNLNLRLFFFLLKSKADLLLANDLDTLPANFLVSRLRQIPLVYDSHEYFTEVPELKDRPLVRSIWLRIEKWILPKLKYAYTVSPPIADAYLEKYGLEMGLVRNFPMVRNSRKIESQPSDQKIVIYQGALNIDRGIEELITAFKETPLEEVKLWIVGSGDIENELQNLTKRLGLTDRVNFFGRLPFEELDQLTEQASIGVSLEQMDNLNYRFAIPNKVFDYLQCGLAVLYSPLAELKRLLADKNIGEELRSHESEVLAEQIASMLNSPRLSEWRANALQAANEFSWQKEEKVLIEIIGNALND